MKIVTELVTRVKKEAVNTFRKKEMAKNGNLVEIFPNQDLLQKRQFN